jgi:uncharacterized protein (DUF362 family)/ferredoxin
MSKVFINSFSGYKDKSIQNFLLNFFDLHAGLLKKSKKILLKPNLLQASIPEKAVTTHPDLLEAVILTLKQLTKSELFLADSPGSNFNNYEDVLKKTGIGDICKKYSINILKVENFKPIKNQDIIYSSIINDFDLLINLPKLKTHSLTGLTLAVKNLFGLIPGTNKVSFHRRYPKDEELADSIYRYFKMLEIPMLHILDGILAHEGEGPSRGTGVRASILACSDDAVAMDISLTKLLGFKPELCKTNLSAIKDGYDLNNISTEVNIDKIPELKLPISIKFSLVPPFVKKIVADKVHVWPVIDESKCINCLLCLKSCPVYAITNSGSFPKIDHKKCIECFCCYEVCESDAIFLKRSLLHRLIVK